ncbi:hypothetical protein [Streptomyces griseorubiginosus]|uniref:hypothetical protein n=1 Tax=Streptomyces griseorubiginosus TaxID=67304 RepID=UPI00332EE247
MSESVHDGGGGLQQAAEAVKEETSATTDQARQAVGEVTTTAAEQAKAVAGEARRHTGAAIEDLRGRAMEEAEGQTRRAAGVLRQWAQDLSQLAEKADGESPARHLVAQVADRGHQAADYVDKQGVEGITDDLQRFARRRPGLFLGGALLAGLAVGRLGKVAGKASQSGDGGRAQSAGTGQLPYSAEPDMPATPSGAGRWTPPQPVSPPTVSGPQPPLPPTSGGMPAPPHPGV